MNKHERENFIITFIFGVATHFFILANHLYNDDALTYVNSLGAGSISGRWVIELLNWKLPVLNYEMRIPMFHIMISILALTLSSLILIRIFDIKNKSISLLISFIMVSSPALVQTFFYAFTSEIYTIAILFIILAVYEDVIKHNYILSIILITLSIGIYQSYICILVLVYVTYYFFNMTEIDIKKWMLYIIKSLFIVIIAFSLYFMWHKIINLLWYDGVIYKMHGTSPNLLPTFDIENIIYDLYLCYIKILDFFTNKNICGHNSTILASAVYSLFIVFTIILFVLDIVKSYLKRTISIKVLILKTIIFILYPIFLNFQIILTNNNLNNKEDRMIYHYIFFIIFPLLYLYKSNFLLIKKFLSKALIILTCVLLYHNVYHAYGSYFNRYTIIESTKALAIEITSQIRNIKGYNKDCSIKIIGDFPLNSKENKYGYYTDGLANNIFSNFDEDNDNLMRPLNKELLLKKLGAIDFETTLDYKANNLSYSDEVLSMPSFPEYGYIKIIDNIVFVKLSNYD